MSTIEFKGDEGVVAIEVTSYVYPVPETESDANWLSSVVTLSVGPFSAKLSAFLDTSDVLQLLQQIEAIYSACDGVANLTPDEETVSLRISVTKVGRVTITGRVESTSGGRATLTFEINSDQSYLPAVIDQLKSVVNTFPVRAI